MKTTLLTILHLIFPRVEVRLPIEASSTVLELAKKSQVDRVLNEVIGTVWSWQEANLRFLFFLLHKFLNNTFHFPLLTALYLISRSFQLHKILLALFLPLPIYLRSLLFHCWQKYILSNKRATTLSSISLNISCILVFW